MNKLNISKLVKLLQKEKDLQKKYADDDLYYRYNLGYLVYTTEKDEEIKYEIRGFSFDEKCYKIRLSVVNWTHHAGTCSIEANWKILAKFRYEGERE